MMYNFNQLRRDAVQLELDLHDLARAVDRTMPDRSNISRDLRMIADQMAAIASEIVKEIVSQQEVA